MKIVDDDGVEYPIEAREMKDNQVWALKTKEPLTKGKVIWLGEQVRKHFTERNAKPPYLFYLPPEAQLNVHDMLVLIQTWKQILEDAAVRAMEEIASA